MRIWVWFQEALSGPGRLRFLIQPLIAVLLGIRDGRLDAAAGRAPYLIGLLRDAVSRRTRLLEGLRAAAIPLAIAIVLDGVLQVLATKSVRPGVAIVMGGLLVALPYMVARALGNRAATVWKHRATRPPVDRPA